MRVSRLMLLSLGCVLFGAAVHADDTAPRLDTTAVNIHPPYPASALAAKEEGTVVLGAEVLPTGNVRNIHLLQTSGYNDLDAAAINAMLTWRFVPAMNNGQPVDGAVGFRQTFRPPGTPPNEPVPPPRDYLPADIEIDAAHDELQTQDRPLPCANGKIVAGLQFLHLAESAGGRSPTVRVQVSSAQGADEMTMLGGQTEWLGSQVTLNGSDESFHKFGGYTDFGRPVGVSVAWDPSGHVSTWVKDTEKHTDFIGAPPDHLRLSVSAASAKFLHASLMCFPPTVSALSQ